VVLYGKIKKRNGLEYNIKRARQNNKEKSLKSAMNGTNLMAVYVQIVEK